MTEAEPLPRLPTLKTILLVMVAFFGVTFGIYGRGLTSEFVRWDDGMLVYENAAIREISPRSVAYVFTHYDPELYIPLTFLSYQLDYRIGQQDPFIYHFTNLLLHTLNALLVAWLAFLLSRKGWMGVLVGLLFAVHPLHTEAVAWVSARKDTLSTFFFLLSLIGYIRWRDDGSRRTVALSVLAFALGLMSKVMVVTLPVALLLVDWLEGRKWSLRMLTEKIPYLAVAGVFGVIAVFGKTGVIQSSTLSAKILMACKSAVFYLQQIVWPMNFSLLYPYVKPITLSSPDFLVPICALVVLIILAFQSAKRWRMPAFGLAFYLVTVAPTFVNFAKGGELDVYFASDRYAYVPSIGVFLALTWLGWRLVEALPGNRAILRKIGAAVAGAAVVLLGALAFRQSFVWRDTESLFAHVIQLYPESSHVAHNNIGNVHRLKGDYARAVSEYEQAIAIRPHAKTLSNLGTAYRRMGDLTKAESALQRALTVDPRSKEAHFGLGLVRSSQQRFVEARKEYAVALETDPSYEEAYVNVGAIDMATGKLADAEMAFRKAIAINPYFTDAHYNLAVALADQGKIEEAIGAYRLVTQMAPQFTPARLNLGLLLHQSGKLPEARAMFESVLRYDPANRGARSALQQMGAAPAAPRL